MDKTAPPNAGIADQNIHISDGGEGVFYRATVCHITADGGSAGVCADLSGGIVLLFIKEEHTVASAGEGFYNGGADSAGATRYNAGCHSAYLLRLLVRWSEY